MGKTDVISVIVPVFNVAGYLDGCLESIAGQTYSGLEVIVVDDGSTDGSGEACDRWAGRDGRIRVVHQGNGGLSRARNVGLDHATGDYVVFVDSDDVVDAAYVEKLHGAIVRMGVPCVTCGYAVQGPDGSEKASRPTEAPEAVSARECLSRVLAPSGRSCHAISVTAWCKIYRRSLFERAAIRFPEGQVYEDVSVFCSVVEASGAVGLIPDVLYYKQERDGSITHTSCAGHIRDHEHAVARFAREAKGSHPDLAAAADRWLEKARINHWFMWRELEAETDRQAPGDAGRAQAREEAREGASRARAQALGHRRDLALPGDLRDWLKLALIRFAPGLALPARRAWRALKSPDQIQRNAVRYGATVLLNYLLSFLTVFYAARVLAAEALGSVSFASSVVGYFALLAQMGIPLYGMRLCAQSRGDPRRLSQAVADLFAIGALLTAASLALLALATRLVPQLGTIAPLMAVFGVGLAAQCMNFEWAFKGLEEYRYLLARSVAVKALALVLVVVLVHGQGDLYRYAAISAGSAVACGLIDFVRIRRFVSVRHVGRLGLRRHVRPVMTFFLMSCATLVYANLDTVMLGFMRDAAEVGYYQIAVKAKVALTAIGGIVWNAALPRATALWSGGDHEGFQRLAQRSLRFVCMLQAAVTVVFMAAAEPAILLIAGDGYLPAVPAFRILLLTLLPIGASNIIGGQVLIPAGKERRLLAAELAGAALNLVCNFALIPVLGIEGAAASTVAAEVVVAVVAYRYAWKDLRVVLFPWDRRLWGFLGAAKASAVAGCYRVAGFFIPDGKEACYCPCCDTKLRAWRVAGFSQRPDLYDVRRYEGMPQDVVCPVCGSIPRHRIIAWHLGYQPELLEGRSVLHFAPERSLSRWLARRGVDVTTADLSTPADLKLDLMALDLPDCSYDAIVCNHVLEHVRDYCVALGELHRVLRPGGLLVISFPVDPRLQTVDEDPNIADAAGRIARFGQHDHLRVFGADSSELLTRAGFRVEIARGADCPDVIRPVTGPADYDSPDIFFCWK